MKDFKPSIIKMTNCNLKVSKHLELRLKGVRLNGNVPSTLKIVFNFAKNFGGKYGGKSFANVKKSTQGMKFNQMEIFE